ncbi:hypothetical protein DICPUDRAFT_156161 [Dictyostelium purpureum]|uniref:Uncharacterized protein n=1 Tax=Dictyostelium purpureum TaxID=5786 RepID=F0ZVV7_DICPU|nr:uncharacterized protein DICPUDRAFT_156161 [Dictyostelium purpureum]EGC31912.1 hypothetical protein DICPUDRAFT_156161 [Dictyostelium purpureum]|eukprot:XP_003291549.1 hypothetical protein DICPUDRAFT_156161 [Dictyostelium purpureum]
MSFLTNITNFLAKAVNSITSVFGFKLFNDVKTIQAPKETDTTPTPVPENSTVESKENDTEESTDGTKIRPKKLYEPLPMLR